MNTQTATAPNVKQAVPFFLVSSIEDSVRFYIEGLGFEMTNQWIVEEKLQWCWLEFGGAAVMLQEYRKDGKHARVFSGVPGQGVSIYFICEDALAIYREAKARGVAVSRPFVGNGMWVTSVADPDGYMLHFESLTDVPEETELSDEDA